VSDQHATPGLRIRQLRLAKGFTLEQLTEQMGSVVSKQALSKYEKGEAFPRPRTLAALASALGVKASELFGEPTYRVDCLQYRVRSPLAPRTKERVEAELSTRLERRLALEDRLFAAKRVNLPVERRDVTDVEEIEDIADEFRRAWNLGFEPIPNLSEVLERHSIHVFEMDGGLDFDGLAAVARTEDGDLRGVGIAENVDTDGDRQRFNLAHELGHVVVAPVVREDEEKFAHRFAGAFLIPRSLVFAEVGERRKDVSWDELLLLKRRWGVSVQAILHRLDDLGIITRPHYEWWCREIRALGFKKVEPLQLPREVSTWEHRQVARAEAEGLMSKEQAATYLPEPGPKTARVEFDRRALMKLAPVDRREVLRAQAERLAEQYEGELDREWLDADIGE